MKEKYHIFIDLDPKNIIKDPNETITINLVSSNLKRSKTATSLMIDCYYISKIDCSDMFTFITNIKYLKFLNFSYNNPFNYSNNDYFLKIYEFFFKSVRRNKSIESFTLSLFEFFHKEEGLYKFIKDALEITKILKILI